MAVVYRFRIVDEGSRPAEELVRCAAGHSGIKPRVVGYDPPLPWDDSSLVGKHVILESEAAVAVFGSSMTVAGLGYKLIEGMPKETAAKQDWYVIARINQESVRRRQAARPGVLR